MFNSNNLYNHTGRRSRSVYPRTMSYRTGIYMSFLLAFLWIPHLYVLEPEPSVLLRS